MAKWLLRGLVFAALMVVVRLVQGLGINTWETQAMLVSIVLVVLFVIVVVIWGYLDGHADAEAQPDPDRRADLAMMWLVAGLVAGVLSGAVAWFISLFYKPLYVEGLVNEVTTFAAFTALLVFLPAIAAVAIGHYLVDRKAPPFVRKTSADGDERVNTDVFAAVHDDDQAEVTHEDAQPAPVGAPETAAEPDHTAPIAAPPAGKDQA
jgi:MFS family permease